MKHLFFLSGWLLGWLLFSGLPTAAETVAQESGTGEVRLEDLAVLALDPAEGRAVLQLPDGSLRTVTSGEELPEARLHIRKVLADRLVVEDANAVGDGTSRRQIWIFRARPGERSRVQVLDRERPARPPILKPQPMDPEKDSGNG